MLAAAEHQYRTQQALAARATRDATRLWQRLDPRALSESFRPISARLVRTVTAAQLVAAARADEYVTAALQEQQIDPSRVARVDPRGYAGAASDGRSLASLVEQPLVASKVALAGGAVLEEALAAGLVALVRIVGTQVADAGRAAESAAIVARPRACGWVRMLQLPSCGRCVVLAGRYYRWSAGFQRHPLCDCRHIPTAEDVANDLTTNPRAAIAAGQVRGLSNADTRAVLDGADVGRVINARRGMGTATVRGRRLKTTTEIGRRDRGVRLRPESIYDLAGDDRNEALRLLREHRYLL